MKGSYYFVEETLHFKKNSARGSLSRMLAVEFPKPNGHPQLVVTSKQAYVIDAHIQDKILVNVKAPKPGSFWGSTMVYKKNGRWSLVVDNSTVYCYYNDDYVRATWRVELAPKEGAILMNLNQGFSSIIPKPFHVAFLIIAILSMGFFCLCGILTNIEYTKKASEEHYKSLSKQVDSIYSLVYDMSDEPNSKKNRGPTGPPRPDHPNMPPGPAGPLGEESGPAGLLIKVVGDQKESVVFKPGTELKSGESFEFNHGHKFKLNKCVFTMMSSSINFAFPHDLNDCVITMQRDGNMVLYHPENGALWSSKDSIKKLCPKGITLTKGGVMICA